MDFFTSTLKMTTYLKVSEIVSRHQILQAWVDVYGIQLINIFYRTAAIIHLSR